MKKILFLTTGSVFLMLTIVTIAASLFFVSCKKDDKEKTENLCPVIAESAVTQLVKDSFAIRYPAISVITWFNKDSVAFCAYFKTSANIEKLAEFDNNGIFVKEKTETHDNEAEDSVIVNGVKTGKVSCECETHKERGD